MGYKSKFISSKFKFLLSLTLIIIFLSVAIMSLAFYFAEFKYIYLILALSTILFAVIICFLLNKMVYIVYVGDNEFKFYSSVSRKQSIWPFSDILNIYEFTFLREGTIYILEKSGKGNILGLSYPYRFDKTKNTENLIKNVLKMEVKNSKNNNKK